MKAFVNFRRGDSPSITARIHECLKSLGWNVFVDVDSLALGADFRNFDYFSRSGDDDLDRSLIIELKRIVKILEINPGFKHINQMNAFAEPQIIVEGTQGTVFLGLPLIKSLMQEKDGGISVAGVCAHECGHIYQLKHGIMTDEIGISVLELHADFIAGYYIGRRSGYTSDQVKTFSASIYKLGDYQYSDPAHHGSPGQRSAAVERGYRVATEGSNINDASNIGLSYAKSLQ